MLTTNKPESIEVLIARGRALRNEMIADMAARLLSKLKSLPGKLFTTRPGRDDPEETIPLEPAK